MSPPCGARRADGGCCRATGGLSGSITRRSRRSNSQGGPGGQQRAHRLFGCAVPAEPVQDSKIVRTNCLSIQFQFGGVRGRVAVAERRRKKPPQRRRASAETGRKRWSSGGSAAGAVAVERIGPVADRQAGRTGKPALPAVRGSTAVESRTRFPYAAEGVRLMQPWGGRASHVEPAHAHRVRVPSSSARAPGAQARAPERSVRCRPVLRRHALPHSVRAADITPSPMPETAETEAETDAERIATVLQETGYASLWVAGTGSAARTHCRH